MIDQSRVKAFLDGLARLSEQAGVGMAFGGPGNESRMRLVDPEGNELLEVGELAPVGSRSASGLTYRLVFSGTLSFSSAAEDGAVEESLPDEPAIEYVLPGRRLSRLSGSVVRVDRRFGGDPLETDEDQEAAQENSSVASGA